MTNMIKYLVPSAGLVALATAASAPAQYAYPYGYNSYNNATQFAAQRCSAAVQNRLSSNGLSIFGIQLGSNSYGRVLGVTQVTPRANTVRVRGIASSGRMAYNDYGPYGPYGVGAYGALGYNYAPPADLSFRCDVDYRGRIRDIDINRR